MTLMPEPSKSSSSSRARSRAASGRAAGPALKFMARVMSATVPPENGMLRAVKRGLAAALLLFCIVGCNGKVTRDDCAEMLEKYLAMTSAGDPSLEGLTPSEAKAARDMKVALR